MEIWADIDRRKTKTATWWWRQKLQWCIHKPRNAKNSWQTPEAGRDKEGLSSTGFRGNMALPTSWFQISSHQNCETKCFCLYDFVMAALAFTRVCQIPFSLALAQIRQISGHFLFFESWSSLSLQSHIWFSFHLLLPSSASAGLSSSLCSTGATKFSLLPCAMGCRWRKGLYPSSP